MARVQDVDLGYRRIVNAMERLDGVEISAGILRDAGTSSRGIPLVNIAIWNEFGTRRIPSRPFVRIASDDNRRKWERLAGECVGRVIDGRSVSTVGATMGEQMKKDIQEVFGDKSRLAPNAPSTIRRKGHDKPLIDTGTLKKSVNYRVE